MKKIGLLFMVLVIALAGIGAAFAAWTDTITIEGKVETGSVDLNVVRYSGTWVWKVPEHGIVVWHAWADELAQNTPANGQLIAWAFMRPGTNGEADVVGEACNIFPGVEFVADVLLHYNGSIPAIVYAEVVQPPTGDPELTAIMGWDYTTSPPTPYAIHDCASVGTYDPDTGVFEGRRVNSYLGVQMHKCEYMLLEVKLDLPQDNDLMNKSATWKVNMNAVQWNKASGYVPGW